MNFFLLKIKFIIIFCQFSLVCLEKDSDKKDNSPRIYVTVNTTTNSSNTNTSDSNSIGTSEEAVDAGHKLTSCTKYFGKKLKECMHCLSVEDFQKDLLSMNSRTRRHYYGLLTISERVGLRDEFSRGELLEKKWLELSIRDPDFVAKINEDVRAYKKAISSFF